MLTLRPPPLSRIAAKAGWETKKVPFRGPPKIWASCCSVSSSKGLLRRIPALLTRMFSPPSCSSARSTIARPAAPLPLSCRQAPAPPPPPPAPRPAPPPPVALRTARRPAAATLDLCDGLRRSLRSRHVVDEHRRAPGGAAQRAGAPPCACC